MNKLRRYISFVLTYLLTYLLKLGTVLLIICYSRLSSNALFPALLTLHKRLHKQTNPS